jgi:hypothetical protein
MCNFESILPWLTMDLNASISFNRSFRIDQCRSLQYSISSFIKIFLIEKNYEILAIFGLFHTVFISPLRFLRVSSSAQVETNMNFLEASFTSQVYTQKFENII